jgi:hypothetical protein
MSSSLLSDVEKKVRPSSECIKKINPIKLEQDYKRRYRK